MGCRKTLVVVLTLAAALRYVAAEFSHEVDMPHAEPPDYTPGLPAVSAQVISQIVATVNFGLGTSMLINLPLSS